MSRRFTAIAGFVFVSLAVVFVPALAQSSDCAALIQSALSALEQACSAAGGNTACFGSAASASLVDGSNAGFSQPGDIVSLDEVTSIRTLPFDGAAGEWGLAQLRVHANVPLALSETGLNYVLLGDVEVENAVPADQAFAPVAPIMVRSVVGANLRASPSAEGRVIDNAPVGTEMAADGLSKDKNWLRVLKDNSTAWISRQVVSAVAGNIDDLPAVGSDTRTLMQAFYLRTGAGAPECSEAPPSLLVIQGPDGMTASISVNGADIRIGSTIALAVFPGNVLHLFVLSGGANVGGISVPAGFTINIQLSEDGRSVAGSWTGLRPITDGERAALTPLENIPASLLYYPLEIPTQEQVAALLAQLNRGAAGQVVSGPAAGRADCSRFKPTSPLEGMPFGLVNFYWDAAPGATTYRLKLYDGGGALVSSFDVNSVNTTIQIDTGSLGGGDNYAWDVDALVDGQVACTTGRVTVIRAAGVQPVGSGGPAPAPTQTCTWGC